MTADEAADLIGPAVPPGPGRWADLGAGDGTFAEALARRLGPDGTVVALDRDDGAVRRLRRLAAALPDDAGRVVVVHADLDGLDAVPELDDALDGVLFANVLHFFREPDGLLRAAAARLKEGGTIVVVEYDGVPPSPWVPHPLPPGRLLELARAAALSEPRILARRPSRYRGGIYSAALAP